MRTENQIRKRLRQLRFRAFQKRARAELKVVPANCAFNRPTSTTFPDGRPFRVCGLALEADPREYVGCNKPTEASGCESFVHHMDKASVKDTVEQEMSDPEAGLRDYPAVAALMWVLEESEAEIEEPEEEPVRWWQFWRWGRHRRRQ